MATKTEVEQTFEVTVPAGDVRLAGDLTMPDGAAGVVAFAHGSGSSRFSSRNRFVAAKLNEAHLGTLLIDLLTAQEERFDELTAHLRFDIGLLAARVAHTVGWLRDDRRTASLPIGLFGASTGAAAALVAAAQRPGEVGAVVSRGGRPDLADEALGRVRAPTLLIVGGEDDVVIELNEQAMQRMTCEKNLVIVPGAGHLFEEPRALEQVADLARDWFARHLRAT